MIKSIPVKPYKVKMVCDKCKTGEMEASCNTMLAVYPPKYPHTCNVCGYTESYDRLYPYIEYEVEDED